MGKDVGFRKRCTALTTLASDYVLSRRPPPSSWAARSQRLFLVPMSPFSTFILCTLLEDRWPLAQHAHPATRGLPETQEGAALSSGISF